MICNMMAVIALSVGATTSSTLTWQADYQAARTQVASTHKPLAVFFGTGAAGYSNVVREGKFDASLNKLLSEKYVCVYVDTTTTNGQALASTFEVGSKGLVISDATGAAQAYSLSGDAPQTEVVTALTKYSAATPVTKTESVVREAPMAAPAVAAPVYTSGCANGRCGTITISNCASGTCSKAVASPVSTCTTGTCPKAVSAPVSSCPTGTCPNAAPVVTYPAVSGCASGNCPKATPVYYGTSIVPVSGCATGNCPRR
jgi:hypothetical protein